MKLDYDVVLPNVRTKKVNMARKLIKEFLKSGQEVAEVIAVKDCYKNNTSAYSGYRTMIKKMDLNGKVAAITSGDRLFLVRLEGEKQ